MVTTINNPKTGETTYLLDEITMLALTVGARYLEKVTDGDDAREDICGLMDLGMLLSSIAIS